MSRKALLSLCVAILIPVISYLLVKSASDHAVQMPLRYFPDTVITKIKDGKEITDTIWHQVKDFTLTNQLGNTVTLRSLKGKVIIADFFFTHCGSICPQLTRNMKKLQDAIKGKDETRHVDSSFIQFLSFSVDPGRDSAEVLKKYADKYGVNHDVWWMLTGPKKTIYDFALDELKLGIQDSVSVDSSFVHTDYFTLLDRDQVVRGYYHGLDSASLSKLAEDIVFIMLEKDKKAKSVFAELRPLYPVFLIVLLGTAIAVVYFSRRGDQSSKNIRKNS